MIAERRRGLCAIGIVAAIGALLFAQESASPAQTLRTHGAMVDAMGNVVPAGPCPQRIVSLSPSLTEILFALGIDPERIVGVTRYCDFPPEAKERPQIGGILDPSLERIRMQRPDLVLAARGTPIEALSRIRALGFPVFAVDDRCDLAGIERILRETDELVCPDDTARATRMLRRFTEGVAAYRAWSAGISDAEKPRVLYADPEYPGWSAGPGSHIDDLIRLAGGKNVVTARGWPQISAEMVLTTQPERFLLALPAGGDTTAILKGLRATAGWSGLRSLALGRICWVGAGMLQRPGPRSLTALEMIAACLHPERPLPGERP